jgi:predicted NACHT family NTPase
MLEWLTASTGIALAKLVLEQVLNLGKSALEDYVKDFFKGCIQNGVVRAKAEVLKQPMAEALGFWIKRFVKELQMNEVPETSIEHHYRRAIQRFVNDKSVRPLLGKAFETNCKQIDFGQLQQIWTQDYQKPEWQFPTEDFDWRSLAKEYVYEVKGIIKAHAELRSLLETELLETLVQNTANLTTQISPGFDVAKYRDSLQCSYGYLKLYTLDSTDRTDAIKLWNLFIEQTVREALPPQKSELLENSDFSMQAYFQQPARKVLEAIADSHHAVILGDPGAGKSTVLQYLALNWVEGETAALPLLIELREYAINPSQNFLEFLHRGRGVDWQFDQQQLHQYLQEQPTLIMFDGLDEVFDRTTQATIIDDIIRFSQHYPKTQILITSRIIGYNPDRLQQADFRHFTIQPLETDEIHEFIDRWYTLAIGNDADKSRLVTRLKDAIANSKAIQTLADNPLLLTMMAILNRRQELPRDRADLYDQASRVLLYHWDVDHKRLQLPMDAIGRREKQEMLRAIAYEMQAGEAGLKGNLISAERLTRILTNYLRDQGFSEPREKANRLIQQLRERNFILCYRGADTYGFVHRTFLEYFCAMEIVNRFEKQRSLTFEQLRDEVFGQHWQDETWHEVLRLICGAIDPQFVGEILCYLIEQDGETKDFSNLFLAVKCLIDVKSRSFIVSSSTKLKNSLLMLTDYGELSATDNEYTRVTEIRWSAIQSIAICWHDDPTTLSWLKIYTPFGKVLEKYYMPIEMNMSYEAARQIASGWSGNPTTFNWLQNCVQFGDNRGVRWGAIEGLADHWKDQPETALLIKSAAQNDIDSAVRVTALIALVEIGKDESWIVDFLCHVTTSDSFEREHAEQHNPRKVALEALFLYQPTHPKTIALLRDRALNDPDEQLRQWAQERLDQIAEEGG